MEVTPVLATAIVINCLLLCWADDSKLDPKLFDIKTNTFNLSGKCVRRIKIEGNGVKDSLDTKCVDYVVDVLRTDDALVYGHPPVDTFYLYSDKPYHLVVVNQGRCLKKKYSVKGRNTRFTPMAADECAAVRRRVSELYSSRDSATTGAVDGSSADAGNKFDPKKFIINTNFNPKKSSCESFITIKGNGVEDSFKTGCSRDGEKITRRNGVMLYGTPPDDKFYMMSDTPSTLLVFDGDKCTRNTYTGSGNKKTTTTLSDEDCAEVVWRGIDLFNENDSDELKNDVSSGGVENTQSMDSPPPTGPTNNNDTPGNQGNGALDPGNFHINTNTLTINGRCVTTVNIEGNIVSDSYQTSCSPQGVNIARQNGVMVYGQPPRDAFYLYCDSQDTVVVIQEGECVKKTYSSKGREPTSTPLTNSDCDAVKNRVADLTTRHGSSSQLDSLLQKLYTTLTSSSSQL